MSSWTPGLDLVLLVILPYLSIATLLLVSIQRYRSQSFTYSSLSSQFLENRQHFWGSVPFHYGIIAVIAGHVIAFAFPSEILGWNTKPGRLYALEVSALVFSLMALVGLLAGMVRRWTSPKVRMVTTVTDWILLSMLAAQVASGIGMAILYPWGSSWFASSVAPYLWSLVKLNPEISYVAAMPHLVKGHFVGAFLLIGFFPFTRLVHILVIPNPYLWRKTQVVRWLRRGPSASE